LNPESCQQQSQHFRGQAGAKKVECHAKDMYLNGNTHLPFITRFLWVHAQTLEYLLRFSSALNRYYAFRLSNIRNAYSVETSLMGFNQNTVEGNLKTLLLLIFYPKIN